MISPHITKTPPNETNKHHHLNRIQWNFQRKQRQTSALRVEKKESDGGLGGGVVADRIVYACLWSRGVSVE